MVLQLSIEKVQTQNLLNSRFSSQHLTKMKVNGFVNCKFATVHFAVRQIDFSIKYFQISINLHIFDLHLRRSNSSGSRATKTKIDAIQAFSNPVLSNFILYSFHHIYFDDLYAGNV